MHLKSIGVDLVLAGFLHFIEEVEYFGRKVLPLVRELEAQRAATNADTREAEAATSAA